MENEPSRSQHGCLDWSEPSAPLSPYLAPPHAAGDLQLLPLGDSVVQRRDIKN